MGRLGLRQALTQGRSPDASAPAPDKASQILYLLTCDQCRRLRINRGHYFQKLTAQTIARVLGVQMASEHGLTCTPLHQGSLPCSTAVLETKSGCRVKRLQLNVYIASASDGFFTVKAAQMPQLSAQARTLADIPDAVRSAAAAITGQPADVFDVVIDF